MPLGQKRENKNPRSRWSREWGTQVCVCHPSAFEVITEGIKTKPIASIFWGFFFGYTRAAMSNSDHGTAAWARGSAIGAMVLTLFGAAWFFAGLANWADLPRWLFWIAGILPAGLCGIAVWPMWNANRLPASQDPELAARRGRRAGMIFGIVFGVEGILIAGASVTLARRGHATLIPLAAAIIIGLHFLPLAHTF